MFTSTTSIVPLVPYEITAVGLIIEYRSPPVNIAVRITIMITVIVGLSCFHVKFYGEIEFWFADTKVIVMNGLLMLSTVRFLGGGPDYVKLSFEYWKDPGAGASNTNRFLALLSTIVLPAFPFAFAPEILIATGGEMRSLGRELPTAARRYI